MILSLKECVENLGRIMFQPLQALDYNDFFIHYMNAKHCLPMLNIYKSTLRRRRCYSSTTQIPQSNSHSSACASELGTTVVSIKPTQMC